MKFDSPESFRTALLDRVKNRSLSTVGSSTDMDSLLKITASERFLARLVVNDDRWVLKGGLNLLARLGPGARLTRDADVATGIARSEIEERVRDAADRDLDDFLMFQVRPPVALQADCDEGGMRFRIHCLLAGTELATFNLDVVLLEPAASDVQDVTLPDFLAFAGVPPVTVPALRPGRQAIEKLHAYTRHYASGANQRPRDLVDMLALAVVTPFSASELRSVGTAVFSERARQPWPPPLDSPPSAWAAYWDGEGRARHGLPNVDLAGAFDLLSRFWTPVLDASHVETWRPSMWAWH